MAKIRETKPQEGGFAAGRLMTRVRSLEKDEEPPAGAETVPDNTPETDWEPTPAEG